MVNAKLYYKSSNTKVATVSSTGKITAKSGGYAKITVSTSKSAGKVCTKYVDVFSNGEKVYVVPQTLNKGMAVDRLREKLKPEFVIAAGDSTFDIPMLSTADRGLVPSGFIQKYEIPKTSGARKKIDEMTSKKIFSDALLEKVLKIKTESVAAGIIHTG